MIVVRGNTDAAPLPVSVLQMEKALLNCIEKGVDFTFEEARMVKGKPEETKVALPEPVKASFGLNNIPGLRELGSPTRSTPSVPLTEKNAEYVVSTVSHFYGNYVVLEFVVANTINE